MSDEIYHVWVNDGSGWMVGGTYVSAYLSSGVEFWVMHGHETRITRVPIMTAEAWVREDEV